MPPYIRRIAVVCGYHCGPVEEVIQLNVPIIKEYLDAVIRDIIEHKVEFLICCGGPTFQRSYPGMTEARRMAEYIQPRVPFPLFVYLEENSFTTYDNIKGAAEIVSEMMPRPEQWQGDEPRKDDITIWCEATRALKVASLARRFIGFPPAKGWPWIQIKTSSWELGHPDKEILATLKDWGATKLPFLNTIQRAQRIVKAKLR